MLAEDGQQADVTIYWPRNTARLSTIERTGKCPSYGRPRNTRPNALVVLVDDKGRGLLQFRLARIESGASIVGADGNRYTKKSVLIARKGTTSRPKESNKYPVNRRAYGAFAYFDAKTGEGVLYSLPKPSDAPAELGLLTALDPSKRRHRLLASNVDKTLLQPERDLLRSYTHWIGGDDPFEHHYLAGPRLYTDLFIRPRWTLVEAKASVERDVLRAAIGQLFDYQRYYAKHPRLAVLLPQKPDNPMAELFETKRIAIIWRSRGGAFKDTSEGSFTDKLRAAARLQASAV